jgi:hypothetical protein
MTTFNVISQETLGNVTLKKAVHGHGNKWRGVIQHVGAYVDGSDSEMAGRDFKTMGGALRFVDRELAKIKHIFGQIDTIIPNIKG